MFGTKSCIKKARAVAKRHPEDIVLAADTVVALDNHILGKPQDEAQANKNAAFTVQSSAPSIHRLLHLKTKIVVKLA